MGNEENMGYTAQYQSLPDVMEDGVPNVKMAGKGSQMHGRAKGTVLSSVWPAGRLCLHDSPTSSACGRPVLIRSEFC